MTIGRREPLSENVNKFGEPLRRIAHLIYIPLLSEELVQVAKVDVISVDDDASRRNNEDSSVYRI